MMIFCKSKTYILLLLFYSHFALATNFSFQNNACDLQGDGKIVAAGQVVVDGAAQFIVGRYTTVGALDTAFNTVGYNATPPVGTQSSASGVGIDSSGNIIAAGYTCDGSTKVAVQRYTSGGTLDGTFGTGGSFTFSIDEGAQANRMVVQSDDKIVVVGTAVVSGIPTLFVARITTGGALDVTFNTTGIAYLPIVSYGQAVVLDGTDIIVAGFTNVNGSNEFVVGRFDTNGALDTSGFNAPDGYAIASFGVDSYASGVAVQSDTKILVAGFAGDDIALARYDSAGVLDPTYDSDGLATVDINGSNLVYDLKLQSDNKAIIGLAVDGQFTIARITTGGILDTTFNTTGYHSITSRGNSEARSIAIQPDTNIVGAGSAILDAVMARFTSTGIFDTTFGNRGVAYEPGVDNNGLLDGHVWSFDTTTQGVITANSFQDVTFTTNVFLNKWDHISGSEIFTCNRTGLYVVTYTLQANINALIASTFSARALLNGSEVDGSQAALGLGLLSNQTIQLARTFIVECNAGDELKIQFTGSSSLFNRLLQGLGSGSLSKPSASLTIQRIQG